MCGTCVLRRDHHCVWINGCVGHANYRFFLRFLVWLCTGCLFIVACWTALWLLSPPPPSSSSLLPPLLPSCGMHLRQSAALCFVAVVGIVLMLRLHVPLVARNETSVEECFNEAQSERMAAKRRKGGGGGGSGGGGGGSGGGGGGGGNGGGGGDWRWRNSFDRGDTLLNCEQVFGRLRWPLVARRDRRARWLALLFPFVCHLDAAETAASSSLSSSQSSSLSSSSSTSSSLAAMFAAATTLTAGIGGRAWPIVGGGRLEEWNDDVGAYLHDDINKNDNDNCRDGSDSSDYGKSDDDAVRARL
jgi:hypothetical protein